MTKLPHDGFVRFHAYLDPANQWVIGRGTEYRNGIGMAVLRPLSQYNDLSTVWGVYYVNDTQFKLRCADSPQIFLAWNVDRDALRLVSEMNSHGRDSLFTIDDLDPHPWFALNNWDKSRVADISESMMVNNRYVIRFPWNGGDNQKWRFEVAHR
ncbi:hypothetical protein [Caulobacter sp. 1776]|uniref:hypothetical protein n=1 Tax=Caulobacter sp. 1776 TaxID=3156420 RepID=UPI0033944CC5